VKTRRYGRRDGEGLQIGDVQIRVKGKSGRGRGRQFTIVVTTPDGVIVIPLDRPTVEAEDRLCKSGQ